MVPRESLHRALQMTSSSPDGPPTDAMARPTGSGHTQAPGRKVAVHRGSGSPIHANEGAGDCRFAGGPRPS